MAFINAVNFGYTLATGQVVLATSNKSISSVGLDVGQLLIGNGTSTAPTATVLTAGTGINITNAAGSITIASSATAASWNVISAATTASLNQDYLITNTSTLTLPAPTAGAVIEVAGPAGGYIIQAPSGVTIQIGNVTGAAAGSATSQGPGDAVKLVGTSSSNWIATSMIGTFNLV